MQLSSCTGFFIVFLSVWQERRLKIASGTLRNSPVLPLFRACRACRVKQPAQPPIIGEPHVAHALVVIRVEFRHLFILPYRLSCVTMGRIVPMGVLLISGGEKPTLSEIEVNPPFQGNFRCTRLQKSGPVLWGPQLRNACLTKRPLVQWAERKGFHSSRPKRGRESPPRFESCTMQRCARKVDIFRYRPRSQL